MSKPLYKSPLRITDQSPSFVDYEDALSGIKIGTVYYKDQKWYLSTCFINNWNSIEVFSKYQGFLFLNRLHKDNK